MSRDGTIPPAWLVDDLEAVLRELLARGYRGAPALVAISYAAAAALGRVSRDAIGRREMSDE